MKISIDELQDYLSDRYCGWATEQGMFMKLVEEMGEAAEVLNMRSGAGTDKAILGLLPKGATFRCYGYYTKQADGTVWLYGVAAGTVWPYGVADGLIGYCSKAYLK